MPFLSYEEAINRRSTTLSATGEGVKSPKAAGVVQNQLRSDAEPFSSAGHLLQIVQPQTVHDAGPIRNIPNTHICEPLVTTSG